MTKYFFITMLSWLFAFSSFSQTPGTPQSLKAVDFKKLIDSRTTVLIDVRTPEEFSEGHITGAININVNDEQFVKDVKKQYKNKALALYCRSGHRSKVAASKLVPLKVKIYDLDGGFKSWEQSGLPVEK